MDDCAFCNADGDFLIVPQKGSEWVIQLESKIASFFFKKNFGPLDGHTVFHDYETLCLPLMLLRLVSVFSVWVTSSTLLCAI
jgi:hypothetical protein